MRYLFLIFFILFSTNIYLIADSQGGRQNSDFTVSGIKLGDKLINHFTLNEIESARTYEYPNKKDYYDLYLTMIT